MVFHKVILQSTSRMSLNDRFTGLRNTFDATDGESAGLVERRQVVVASRKNQRLAQQMEHRPAVIAALRSSSRGGRGRVAVGRGLLRGARGARGVIRVGGAASRGVSSVRPTFRGTTRGGFTRGVRGATAGFRGTRGASASYRGVSAARGTVSIRGINFKTGAPLRGSAGVGRGAMSNGSTAGAATAVPVKKRLAVQGRLSGPTVASTRGSGAQRGWVRGGFKAAATGFTRGNARGGSFRGRLGVGRGARGQGATASYNAGFHTRTFRGRGRGTRGSRGGYSQQWENGY